MYHKLQEALVLQVHRANSSGEAIGGMSLSLSVSSHLVEAEGRPNADMDPPEVSKPVKEVVPGSCERRASVSMLQNKIRRD